MRPDAPLCPCHGLEMGFKRNGQGGVGWECREKRREYNQRRHAQRLKWVQDRRDRDPIYRIGDELERRRRQALQRMAKRHLPREELGSLPE